VTDDREEPVREAPVSTTDDRRTDHMTTTTAARGRPAATTRTLARTTFRTSRLLDFCSKKELTAQTGHPPAVWPLVVLKELLDNALDACEDAATPPEVVVTVNPDGIAVSDNGPGIPPETVGGCSTSRSASPAAKRMCRRAAAPRAMP
jgi:hypothetical protein